MGGKHSRKVTRNHQKRKRFQRIAIGSVVGCLVLGGGAYYGLTRPLSHVQQPAEYKGKTLTIKKSTEPAERTNILLAGTDTRPGDSGGNSDVLILCSIDRKNKRIELMSIPRDTKVMFPDGTYGKINEGLALGGTTLTEDLVQTLIDQPIDYYALTHFGGLVDIINTIGGVNIDVAENMYYNTGDKQYNIINLKKGEQTLTGEQALGFVRFRHDALGDIGRTERQQEFLQALAQKLLQPENVTKLPTLVKQFWGTIDTDMNLLDVVGLATKANDYEGYQIIHETLPGSFHDPDPNITNDASYWIVNPLEAKYMAKQFFENGDVVKNPVQDPNKTANWQPPVEQSSPTTNTTGGAAPSPSNGTQGSGSPSSGTSNSDTSNSGTSNGGSESSVPSSTDVSRNMVTTHSANIRSGPGANYDVIASMQAEQTVWVLAKTGDWYEVMVSGGQTGYVASWLLSDTNP